MQKVIIFLTKSNRFLTKYILFLFSKIITEKCPFSHTKVAGFALTFVRFHDKKWQVSLERVANFAQNFVIIFCMKKRLYSQ